jgi:hypothetical protein
MKPTQHFVVTFRLMRTQILKVPGGLSLSRYKKKSVDSRHAAIARTHAKSLARTTRNWQRGSVSMSIQERGERHVERMAGISERAVDHIETYREGVAASGINAA